MLTLVTVPAFRNAYLRRGLFVWAALRLVLLAGLVSHPGAGVRLFVLASTAVAVILDARYRKEDVFLGNLGVPLPAAGLCALPLPLLAELLLP